MGLRVLSGEKLMEGMQPSEQAKRALRHVLLRIRDDGRINYLMGPGSQTWDLVTEALATLTQEDLETLRHSFFTPIPGIDIGENNG